jgi:hypothetical protein
MQRKADMSNVALFFEVDSQHGTGYDNTYFRVRPVTMRGSSIRNMSTYDEPGEGGPKLDSLTVEAFGYTAGDGSRDANQWTTYYREVQYVTRVKAEGMARTLRTIERGLEKADFTHGYAQDFGEYVARVAHALGITTLVIRVDANRASSYDDMSFTFNSMGAGVDVIRRHIGAWLAGEVTVAA